MLKSGRAVKSTRVLQHIRRRSGHRVEVVGGLGLDPKRTSFGGPPQPQIIKIQANFGDNACTPPPTGRRNLISIGDRRSMEIK